MRIRTYAKNVLQQIKQTLPEEDYFHFLRIAELGATHQLNEQDAENICIEIVESYCDLLAQTLLIFFRYVKRTESEDLFNLDTI